MNLSRKFAACLLTGVLVCQPVIFNGSDTFTITAEAHGHHADQHHDYSSAGSSESYYYCNGHPGHLHVDGVCPYSTTSVTSSDNTSAASSEITQNSAASQNATISTAGKSITLSTGGTIGLPKELIRLMQDVLTQKGYDCGTADGIVGTKTKDALEKYLDECEDTDTDSLIISMIAEGLGIQ